MRRHRAIGRSRFELSLHMSEVTSSSAAEPLRELGLAEIEVVPPQLNGVSNQRQAVADRRVTAGTTCVQWHVSCFYLLP